MTDKTHYYKTFRVNSGWHWQIYREAGQSGRIQVRVAGSDVPLGDDTQAEKAALVAAKAMGVIAARGKRL